MVELHKIAKYLVFKKIWTFFQNLEFLVAYDLWADLSIHF